MAKAYKAGYKNITTQGKKATVFVTGVSGNPADYRVYISIEPVTSNGSFCKAGELIGTGNTWRFTVSTLADVNNLKLYYAFVKKVRPTVGKPIFSMGSGSGRVIKNINSCPTCKIMASSTLLTRCFSVQKQIDSSGGSTSAVIRWVSIENGQLNFIPLL